MVYTKHGRKALKRTSRRARTVAKR